MSATFEEGLETAAVIAQLRARINALTIGAPPSGPAGGDLTGSYPNPQIAAGVIVDADVSAGAAIAESKLNLATDAAAGVGSRRTLGTGALQAAAGNDPRLSDSRPPNGAAGGDLSGTYPNPQIAAGVIVDADVAAANKDGAAATPSMRTLGTGALQAAAGNDSRLSDARTPTGAAGGDLAGTYPNPTVRNYRHHVVRAAQNTNVNVASPGTTIGGVTMATGDRVLLLNQTTGTQLGIWVWNGAAVAMTRPVDWNTGETRQGGELVAVALGTFAQRVFELDSAHQVDVAQPIFNDLQAVPRGNAGGDLGGTYPSPAVLLTGDGQYIGRTGNTMAPVAALADPSGGLAGSVGQTAGRIARIIKAALYGDGAKNTWQITHNLGTWQPLVIVSNDADGAPVDANWQPLTINQIQVQFDTTILPSGQLWRVTIVG